MLIIIGLVVLLAAVVIGLTGVLANAGDAHSLTDDFSAFGYHVTGSTGSLLLYGIVIGAVGALGLAMALAGARRTARRGKEARHDLAQSQRNTEFVVHERDELAERNETLTEQQSTKRGDTHT
ncbi:MAG: hypothetical protein WAW17_03350 [Rhodococcus sp. (in: high G+C Gram-positive bacteria)]|uniref:hypothetical protein n=1 Tax=Rhodococcus sp. TaxID=1831 RepID=UPI003BAF3643